MDLTQMKVSNTNMVNVADSLKAPLLKLNVKSITGTVAPVSDTTLKIYVDTSSTETIDRKTFTFQLESALEIGDEFILEPSIDGNKVTLKASVERVGGATEIISAQAVELFEGANYISTNYSNAQIDIVYPKNVDLVKLFLNNVIYSTYEGRSITLDDIYFKDCFTEVEAGINAEFNKVTVKCFDSTNQNFSMDCDGNLVVNSITTRQGSSSNIIDLVYPVGSIYINVNNINPGNIIGGTWEQVKGRFLLGTGTPGANNYNGFGDIPEYQQTWDLGIGVTSGEYRHTLTYNEMPSHNGHLYGEDTHYWGETNEDTYFLPNTSVVQYSNNRPFIVRASNEVIPRSFSKGGDYPHNNMPPFLVVSMWKRIA